MSAAFDHDAFWADAEPTKERIRTLDRCGLPSDTAILRALAAHIQQQLDEGIFDVDPEEVKAEAVAIVGEIETLARRVAKWEGPLV